MSQVIPSIEVSNQYFECISIYPMRVTRRAHLILLELITPTLIGEEQKIMKLIM
jgi:hypothetical protein